MIAAMTNIQHNHVTRDIKPFGVCGACDQFHTSMDRLTGFSSTTRPSLDDLFEADTYVAHFIQDRERADARPTGPEQPAGSNR